jgi:hypothetical protein
MRAFPVLGERFGFAQACVERVQRVASCLGKRAAGTTVALDLDLPVRRSAPSSPDLSEWPVFAAG